ncbi:hypothetical protein BCR35DRAFT_335259 [Leucosporidium creatinivorum]|uniref:Uncharacterized protein n=1 Tax=Leucosporidium creatinivorum TaxID=106004 RepID=A0A1Y2DEG3_9BASI|nr:hypothetical protein BCR35DRAFT_335259 [Leucosporidium creatinivorum]
MRGDLGFGEGVDGRALRNESVGAEEEGVGEEAMKLKYDEKVKEGDQGAWKAVWAGTGVRLLVEIRSAEAIVQDFELGAEEGFKALARMSVSEKIEV